MSKALEWSAKMERLFNKLVAAPVLRNPRTDLTADVILGYPFETIRKKALQEGLADFTNEFDDGEHGKLTPAELSLLFCFVNLKGHFFASTAAFQQNLSNLRKLFDERLLVIDVGCGPGTAGLAFADCYPSQMFDYIGVDRAAGMRDKAAEMLKGVSTFGVSRRPIKAHFASDWQEIRKHPFGIDNAVLMLFSYFFASPTLKQRDLVELVGVIKKMKSYRPQKPIAILHINSPRPVANRHYLTFRKLLGFENKPTGLVKTTVEFRKKWGNFVTPIDFLHEFIWI